jgi:triphosphoribosyl-dephospho-CoA synthetase
VKLASRATTTLAVAALVSIISGCGSTHEEDVRAAAERFHQALQAGDGEAACELLSDEVQRELQDASGAACSSAVLESGLPEAGAVERVQVFDTAAQVRYSDDVLFLGDFPDGWRVIAAGCEEAASAPYDCQVHGG